MQSRRYSYEEPYSVLKRRHLATCCTARLRVENFVGGNFRDLSMSHENNEIWHPTKITRYTVVVKAGQYMKTVKAMISIVGSKCVTEEGYCWLNHSVFLFLLAMLLYALA